MKSKISGLTILLLGIPLVTFIVFGIVKKFSNNPNALTAKASLSFSIVELECLEINPLNARGNSADFSIQNNCGGALSVLKEYPSQPQSSSLVGKILGAEEIQTLDDGKNVLETSLESRIDILSNTFNPWYINHFALWRNWKIEGMAGDKELVISGRTVSDGIRIFLIMNKILFVTGLALLASTIFQKQIESKSEIKR